MSQQPQLPIEVIYQYDHHQNIPWNMLQYQPVREYLDPNNIVLLRKYAAQKRSDPDLRYKTKKGFYMDYHIKVVKNLPSPNLYKFKSTWEKTQKDKQRSQSKKVDKTLSKYTYLDRIQIEQKNRHSPHPGTYNLNKTKQQIQKELNYLKTKKKSVGQKRYFYQDTEYLANVPPALGTHNPHPVTSRSFRIDKSDHKFWIKKHSNQESKSQKKNHGPTATSYQPTPLQFGTFDRIYTTNQLVKKRKRKNKQIGFFATDTKFAYDRENKKKIIQKRPDPGDHNMMIEWKGKGLDSKTNNWIRSRSTGFTESVYN